MNVNSDIANPTDERTVDFAQFLRADELSVPPSIKTS